MEDLEGKLEKDEEEPEEMHKKLMKLMKKDERKLKYSILDYDSIFHLLPCCDIRLHSIQYGEDRIERLGFCRQKQSCVRSI